MKPFNDKFFIGWCISFIVEIFFFTLNPMLGIFLAIVMVPVVMHDVLAKFYNLIYNKNDYNN